MKYQGKNYKYPLENISLPMSLMCRVWNLDHSSLNLIQITQGAKPSFNDNTKPDPIGIFDGKNLRCDYGAHPHATVINIVYFKTNYYTKYRIISNVCKMIIVSSTTTMAIQQKQQILQQ